MKHWLAAFVCSVLLSGCASFEEEHYFMTRDSETGEPVNFFRLSVSGGSELSSSRYVSGYYDEAAVDLFFNEIRKSDTVAANGGEPFRDTTLFRRDMSQTDTPADDTGEAPAETGATAETAKGDDKDEGKAPKASKSELVPLGADEAGGAFMMILSSDADSVVNAIGSFAESSVVAESIAALLNRDAVIKRRLSDARMAVAVQQTNAALNIIDSHVAQGKAATTGAEGERAAVYILGVLARELGGNPSFTTIEGARSWFDGRRAASEGAGS